RPDRLDHVVAVVAGSAMGLPHHLELPVVRQPAGVLSMAAVDRIAKRFDAALRLAFQPDVPGQLTVHRGGLLAFAQIGERRGALARRHAVGNAAAGTAEIEAEHEARTLGGAAVVERIDAQRAMHADDVGWDPLEEFETRTPDQRAV